MTTIAYDGKTLAVDSQATCAWRSPVEFQKLFVDVGNYEAVALCGTASDVQPFLGWLEGGCKTKQYPTHLDGFAALAIRKDGHVEIFVDSPYPLAVHHVYAMGSGSEFAMGAMLAGRSARSAVEIAAKLDVYTGGSVFIFDVTNPVDYNVETYLD